jgi:hypothetical protein
MKTKNIIMIILLVFVIPVIGSAMGQVHKSDQIQKSHDVYYCPMHPNYTSDHPGTCPYCGMGLVKK